MIYLQKSPTYYFNLSFLLFSFLQFHHCFAQNEKDYIRYVDSANVALHYDAYRALIYLDSIPKPIEKFIAGKVGKYYLLKGYALDRSRQQAKVYQNYIQALRYAKAENDFDTAGNASLELFTNLYFIKKDTTAQKYLDDAEKYFRRAKNEGKLVEVNQMPAYTKFISKDYNESNKLLLQNLDRYRNVTSDKYYHLFALYLLTSNYIHLNELNNANSYFKEFKSLKGDSTIDAYNFDSFENELHICMSKLHLDNKNIDSTLYYLSKADNTRNLMTIISQGEYYSFYAEAYKELGEIEKSTLYLDSLKQYQENVLQDNIDASLELNTILLDTEKSLQKKDTTIKNNTFWLFTLVAFLFALITTAIYLHSRNKQRARILSTQKRDLSTLQGKHEKLKVKNIELESYIVEIKDKVKKIAINKGDHTQKDEIRNLYRNINAESSNLLNNDETHYNFLRQVNLYFFEQIEAGHPNLVESEILICYYLKLGFKNKEIALFLNRSVRSIESQRYRISSKVNLESSKLLVTYLDSTYSVSET